jgi:multidrug transporter EmrE-like cation transporter
MVPPKGLLPPTWVLFLLLLVAFELLADILAKQFAVSGNFIFALLSLLGFLVANGAWLISLRTGAQLGKGAILFAVLSSIGAVLIGSLLYHEEATRAQFVGVVLGSAAIALLSLE